MNNRRADMFQRMREQYEADMQAHDAEQKRKNIERQAMSAEQRQRLEALDFARANVELSGGRISEADWQRALRWAYGEWHGRLSWRLAENHCEID